MVGEGPVSEAWNYFNLVRAYGRVPLYTEPISSLEETTPQMAESIDKIYDRILEDLLAAEKMLTVSRSSAASTRSARRPCSRKST